MAGPRSNDTSRSHRETAIREHLLASAETARAVADRCVPSILRGAETLAATIAAGGKILLCGNGGSAADCQHMATEFVSRLTLDFARPGIPAVALTTDTSFLTAFANDLGFDDIFARQVETLGRPGDSLIAITTSGRSRNVVRAAERARALGMKVIALTSGDGGALGDLADVAICVPSTSTQHIQESHLAIEHIVCHLVERQLYDATSSR